MIIGNAALLLAVLGLVSAAQLPLISRLMPDARRSIHCAVGLATAVIIIMVSTLGLVLVNLYNMWSVWVAVIAVSFLLWLAGPGWRMRLESVLHPGPISVRLSRTQVGLILVLGMLTVINMGTRLHYVLDHPYMPSIDAYGHLLVMNHLQHGFPRPNLGVYDDYPLGYHLMALGLGAMLGLSPADVQVVLGPVFAACGVLTIFALARRLWGTPQGLAAAVIYTLGMGWRTPASLFAEATQSEPEVLALVLVPVFVILLVRFMGERSWSSGWWPVACFVLILVVHPLTALFVLIVAIGFLILEPDARMDRWTGTIIATLGLGAVILTWAPVADRLDLYVLEQAYVQEALRFQWTAAFTWEVFFVVLLIMGLVLDLTAERQVLSVGALCGVFVLIRLTGFLLPDRLPPYRIEPIAGIFAALFRGWFAVHCGRGLRPFLDSLDPKWPAPVSGWVVPSLVVLVICVPSVTGPLPELAPIGNDDALGITLDIIDEFEPGTVEVYSEKTFLVNRERSYLEPDYDHGELRHLLQRNATEYQPGREFIFVFIEPTRPGGFTSAREDVMISAHEWLDEFNRTHEQEAEIFAERPLVTAYLIKRLD